MKNNEIYDTWKDFLKSIENYIEKRNRQTDSEELMKTALETFKSIPNVNIASIFRLNPETFEFELQFSMPPDSNSDAVEIYNKALESGYIGLTLESGKTFINIAQENPEQYNNEVIIPLSDQSGISGLLIFSHEKHIVQYEQVTLRLISMFGIIISSVLENAKIMKDLEQQTSILEQRISARTMDLNNSRKELEVIFNAVYAGIIVIDENSNMIIKINPKASEILNLDQDIILNTDIDNYLESLNKISTTHDGSNHFESYAINDQGQKIPVLRTIKNIVFGKNKFRVESFIDITKVKEAEDALKKTNEILELKVQERTEDLKILIGKLREEITERENAESEVRKMLAKEKELSELKSKFVSMISHEFRTPLTVIKSSSQLLNKFDSRLDDDERKNYLLKIAKTVDYMTELIDNVIFIGKTDHARQNTTKNPMKIIDFTKNLIDDFKITQKKERKVNLKFDVDIDEINIDDKLLRLILNNLLTNAAKYSDANEPIDFYLQITKENAIFTVRDYGIGIPKQDQDKIFDLFYRAENVGNIAGTGLGMAVITESLKILNGKIEINSKIGKGSEFKIKIPLGNNEKNINHRR